MSKKKSTAPFVVRWRNGVMDDPNPILTWRGLVAAMALTRYADVTTGKNCFPGAQTCADKMRVSKDTIIRGWDELKQAGWLEIMPLPASRRREQGALKVLRWPSEGVETTWPLTAAKTLTAPHMAADSHSTITGNQGGLSTPGETPHPLDEEGGKPWCGTHDMEIYKGLCPGCEQEKYWALHGGGPENRA